MKKQLLRRTVSGIVAVGALLLSVTWAASAVTSTSPVGLWSFDEGTGTIAHDSAGGLDATIDGAVWTTGRLGYALEFDGDDDGVEAPSPVTGLTTAGSLEAWVKPDLIESGTQEIVINGDSSGVTWNIRLYLLDGEPGFSVYSNAGIKRWTVGTTISADEWHHLVGTFDGSTQTGKIYVDGLPAGSWGGAGTTLQTLLQRGLTIGTQPYLGSGWRPDTQFDGVIDEVAIYDTVLSPEEIWDHYVAGSDGEAPSVFATAANPNPVPVGEFVSLSATVDDSQTGNSRIAAAEYAVDGGPYSPMSATDGAFDTPTEAVEAMLGSFDTPDVHTLCVRGTDAAGNTSSEECTLLAVYDPAAGFVTGGGWIDSPAGAYYPSDLPFFDGSFYEIVILEQPLTFAEAREMAEAMTYRTCQSAHLATITSQGEYDAVLELFDTYHQAELGGYQEENELVADEGWEWVTGEPFDIEFQIQSGWWLPNEPNDCGEDDACPPGSEQILEMYPTGWNDVQLYDALSMYAPMIEYEDCDLGPTGKATFGFVSKYKKGASVPTGNTEFQFHAGDLNFHSTSYDWLVVTGSDYAKFKGTGTINGAGEYKFQIWAGDDDPDTFRIKIWYEDADSEVVVYDNGSNQAIGGGNIVVHTKHTK